MGRQKITTTVRILAAGVIATGFLAGATAYAASGNSGAAAALTDKEYTLSKMLTYAIEDEYLAQAEYDSIMETYGDQKPFSNIIKAEARHISMLKPLLEKYDAEVPEKDWDSLVQDQSSLDTAYKAGVAAEEKNIAMYKNFLKEDLPEDVREVFENLKKASEKHLAAFQRKADGKATADCNGDGSGKGGQRGKKNNGFGGNGQGKRNNSQRNGNEAKGDCIL